MKDDLLGLMELADYVIDISRLGSWGLDRSSSAAISRDMVDPGTVYNWIPFSA